MGRSSKRRNRSADSRSSSCRTRPRRSPWRRPGPATPSRSARSLTTGRSGEIPQHMLMFVGDDDEWVAQPKDQLKTAYAEIGRWWDDLEKKGVIKSGGELDHRNTATTVRRVNGEMKVSDGPFIESKEHVGGYALIAVPGL